MVGRDVRSAVRRLLLFANVTAGVGAALFCLAAWLAPESLSVPSHSEPGVFRLDVRGGHGFGIVALAAAALLVCDVLWLVYGGVPKEPSDHVVSKSHDGSVIKVSREALEAGLRTSGESLDEVSRLRVAVSVSGKMKHVLVRAWFQCPDGVSIQLAGQRLRANLRARFADLVALGEGARLEVDIEFVGFSGRLKTQPAEERKAKPEPDDPFTGPRYPIDDEA